jgi:hypothetical protein
LGGRDWEHHDSKTAQAKSLQDLILTNKYLGMVVHVCHPSYAGIINRRIIFQAGPGINMRPYLKNTLNKKSWECGSSGRGPA